MNVPAWDLDEQVAAWPGLPHLDADLVADVCVIGLGASGLAAVRAAVERGLSVIGLDAGRVAGAAAGRNGGFLIAGPAESMTEVAEEWEPGAALWLYRETLAELERLSATLGDEVVRRDGSIRLAGLPGEPADDAERADREAELRDCEAELQLLRSLGLAAQSYDGPLGRGLYLPLDGAVNPARRVVEQCRALEGAARLYEHSPVLELGTGQVVTAAGTVRAGAVIVAVDGGLEVLLPSLAGAVRTTRLQMLATAPAKPKRLPCPVYGRWGYDYAQQDTAGRLYVGGGRDHFLDAEWGVNAAPTAAVQSYIETVAARMADGPVTVTHRWAASVGYTADKRALCVEAAPGVVACGGYSGTGNLVGPVAARAAVDLALDGVRPPAAFRSELTAEPVPLRR